MRLTITFIIAALLAAEAYGWTPEPCSAAQLAGRARFEAHMRTAQPGDAVYVPKPFPKTDAELITDFLYQAKVAADAPEDQMTASGQHALAAAMRNGTLHIGIVREANWRNHRCARYRSGETVYLLRIYDVTSAVEIARATIEASGLLNAIMYPLDRTVPIWSTPFLTLPEGERVLRAHVGSVTDVQFATTYGTVGCDEWMPCVTGRVVGSGGYALVSHTGVYVLNDRSRKIDQTVTSSDRASIEQAAHAFETMVRTLPRNEALTTTGGTAFVVAAKIADR